MTFYKAKLKQNKRHSNKIPDGLQKHNKTYQNHKIRA